MTTLPDNLLAETDEHGVMTITFNAPAGGESSRFSKLSLKTRMASSSERSFNSSRTSV